MASRSALRMRPMRRPIDIQGGRIVFDAVTFHYGGHRDAAV